MSGAILGLDTATPATAAAVLLAGGAGFESRDDPPPGSRGAHASRLLALVSQAMHAAGVAWADLDRLAVGIGPGGFTGLRIGVATARGLAQARGLPLAGVSSLAALAAGAGARPVLAAIDARRGEVYAALWAAGAERMAPVALVPTALAERLAALSDPVLAVGDGAVRFRAELAAAGITVPEDGDAAHRISAGPLCRLGAAGQPVQRDDLLPDYRREPDAKPPP